MGTLSKGFALKGSFTRFTYPAGVCIGVRAIFCQGGGGGGNHLPKKFLQVAQIFTKQSNRNEGRTMQQHRDMKVILFILFYYFATHNELQAE